MSDLTNRYVTPEAVMVNRFKKGPKPDWQIAILCFRDFIGCDFMVHTMKAKPVYGYKVFYGIDANETHQQVFEAEIDGKRIGIITRLSWGGPQAAILVEELSHMGIAYILGYGAAGSIDQGVHKGDLILGTTSFITDGTSRSYLPDREVVYCDQDLLDIIQEVSISCYPSMKEVHVANVDALYRETKDLIRSYQSRGAQIVNLETSALYAAAEICGVKTIWLGFISDSLVSDTWDNWDMDTDELSAKCALICKTAVEKIITR